jgi:ketosteroid isomerase-like protein
MGTGDVMTDRAEIEQLVRNAYAARVRGDVEAILALFDNDPHFELVGAQAASPLAMRVRGTQDFRALLTDLVRTFKFRSHDIITLVIEGSNVAVRGRAEITSTITGETVVTELADFIAVKDGRIASFVQFCDTALAAKLMAK